MVWKNKSSPYLQATFTSSKGSFQVSYIPDYSRSFLQLPYLYTKLYIILCYTFASQRILGHSRDSWYIITCSIIFLIGLENSRASNYDTLPPLKSLTSSLSLGLVFFDLVSKLPQTMFSFPTRFCIGLSFHRTKYSVQFGDPLLQITLSTRISSTSLSNDIMFATGPMGFTPIRVLFISILFKETYMEYRVDVHV